MKIDIMSGAGNIFVVIDNRYYQFSQEFYSKNINKIYHSQYFNNLNFEGLLVINENIMYDFEVWYYNPDGSSGMMCGNGGRCAVRYAFDKNFTDQKEIKFLMSGNMYKSKIKNDTIELYFSYPEIINYNLELLIDNQLIRGDYIDNGSIHYVINMDTLPIKDFNSPELLELAKKIRYNIKFPNGTNVNFYRKDGNIYFIKTYERGVENFTGACGTGTLATAISINYQLNEKFPMSFIPPSGEKLFVNALINNNIIDKLILEGPTKYINSYSVEI